MNPFENRDWLKNSLASGAITPPPRRRRDPYALPILLVFFAALCLAFALGWELHR